MPKALKYAFGAIAIYLGVVYFDGATSDISAGSTGISNIVAAFQGRAVSSATKAS